MKKYLVPLFAFPVLLAHAGFVPGEGAFAFDSENDVYGKWSDQYYTNGLRFVYVSRDQLDARPEEPTLRWFGGFAQEIYTPTEPYRSAKSAPAWDRPYSAWLYATGGVAWADKDSLDLFTLNLGIVGPSALGEQVQNNWHRLLDVERWSGWDTQLHDEAGVGLAWLRVWRIRLAETDSGWGFEALPRVGLEAGTVRDIARAGIQWRFGKNLPEDFGQIAMRDGLTGAAPVKYVDRTGYRFLPDAWYFFADAGVEARAFDMTLDGSIWHDSRSVDREWCVGQFSAGIAAHWGAARVAFTQTVRTKEFKSQSERPFVFGAITVTVSH